jgi:hypothetical protein
MKLAEKLEDQKKQNRAYVEVRPYFPSSPLTFLSCASSSSDFPLVRNP